MNRQKILHRIVHPLQLRNCSKRPRPLENWTPKFAGEIQDPEELERDVYEAIELQDGLTDTIELQDSITILDRLTRFKTHTCRHFWICPNQGTQLLISELFTESHIRGLLSLGITQDSNGALVILGQTTN